MFTSADDNYELRSIKCLVEEPTARGPMTGQKSANCGFKGPQRAFRYVLHRCGLSRAQTKELKFAARLYLIERILADLRANVPKGDHHAEVHAD